MVIALGACADGSVLQISSASLFSGGNDTPTGVTLNNNVTVGGSDVVLIGQNFTGNASQQMFALIVDADSNRLLTQQAGFAAIDAGGNFQMSWKNLVVPGQHLYVAFYADVNQDAICNTIPTDDAWEVQLTTLNQGTVVAVTPDIQQRSVCELFGTYNMTLQGGSALSAHGYPGHTAYALVLDTLDKSQVGETQSATISATGDVAFSWPTLLLNHHNYVIAMCVDTAGNGTCDSSAEFIFQAGPVSADITTKVGSTAATSSATFNKYWPQNLTLPPQAQPAIPTIGAP